MKFSSIKLFSIYLLTSLVFFSCGDKEDDPTITETPPIASFQIKYNESDFRAVSFDNFSQNATAYSWNFGDGNSSTEESPNHTYTDAGEYSVVLTASNADGTTHTQTKTVTITDPNSAIKDLTGDDQKVWKLSRNTDEEEFPLIVGPVDRSQLWWAFGREDPLAFRSCMMEEEYIFSTDGKFTYDSKGQVFADFGVWAAEVEGNCVDETNPENMKSGAGEDLSAWGSGEHTFEYNPAEATLTLIGKGAHIGLPKVGSTAEVASPQEMVVYKVTKLETEGAIDKLQLETTIDDGYWQFNLVSYDDPNLEPVLGAALPGASFSVTVDGNAATFTNTTSNADRYEWAFGDGATSTEESPTHTYMGDGNYTVTLTAYNSDGSSTASQNVIIAINSVFSAASLFGEDSKSWKLVPNAEALIVGPGIGSSEWWPNGGEGVATRDCTLDDTYTFTKDGAYEYNTNGDLWAEPYMGVEPDGCIAEADLPESAKAWASGNHTYTITEAAGDAPAYITVEGTGAFIALPKAYNGGEFAMAPPPENGSVTYQVISYVNSGTSELLVIAVDISAGEAGTGYWTFTLVAQ